MLKEVNKQLIKLNCAELFSSICERRSCEDQNEAPRSPSFQFHLISQQMSGFKIEKYCPRQNSWTLVRKLDLKITLFTVIGRCGKLILIGGRDEQKQILNTVNIESNFPWISIRRETCSVNNFRWRASIWSRMKSSICHQWFRQSGARQLNY